MQSVSCARTAAPESVSNVVSVQRTDAPDWDAVERRYLRALDSAANAKTDPTAVYRIYQGLANLAEIRHEYDKAEKYYQSTVNAAKSLFGDQSEEVMKALNNLGEVQLNRDVAGRQTGHFTKR
jgi:hypothetical protein